MQDEQALRRRWQTLVELGQAVPQGVFGALGESLRASGPWPENLAGSPMILDTDIGADADDALAVAAAARTVPALAAVITGDELPGGRRARFARSLLDALGRDDVVTVAGADLGNTRYDVVDGLADGVPEQRADVVEAVREVCSRTNGPVRWVGMAPLTNLARVVVEDPGLAGRLRVTQMGGAFAYRDPERAEHNIRLDVPAARTVLEAVRTGVLATPEFVASEVTFDPRTEVTRSHTVYRALADAPATAWAHLLREHLDRWFDRFHPGTMQHDALALSAALDLPFVDSDIVHIALDRQGRTTTDDDGTRVRWSLGAAYEPFMSWLAEALDPAATPALVLVGSDSQHGGQWESM